MTDHHTSQVLEIEHLTRDFPGVKALDDVSFGVRRGEVHALVGENGAGKSTLMHILGGVLKPTTGRILLEGGEVRFGNAHDAHKMGVRVVYQELSVVPNLSVAENIFANCQPVNAFGFVNRDELNKKASELIGFFGATIDPDMPVSELSIGERQVVEILKALTFNPRLVLLDEPTSSLSSVETNTLFGVIRRLRDQGMSFMFISHHLPEVFEISDRVTVLRDGCYQGTFDTPDITEDDLIARMVGRTIGDVFGVRREPFSSRETVLSVDCLNREGEFSNVSLTVDAGEIVGIAGLVGAGRTELALSLFGATLPDSGTTTLNGEKLSIGNVGDAIANGICYLTEDRKVHGLFLSQTIRDNFACPGLGRYSRSGILDDRGIDGYAESLRTRFNVVTPSLEQMVFNLSGGNQQKVLLGMWMGIDPVVFIVDEPTRGVDVGAKEEIYCHLRALAESGAAILLISSDLNEILGLSDRIYVMRQGEIAGEISAADATEERVISMALGAGETVQ